MIIPSPGGLPPTAFRVYTKVVPLSRRAVLFFCILALLGAAPVRAPGPLYSPVAPAWTGALGAALRSPGLTASLTPGLASLDAATPAGLRSAAPLVAQLQTALGYTPAAFAALSHQDRESSVLLAAEAAREDVRMKVYELGERARAFSRQDNLDREARAELYGLVAHLGELRDHYRAFLDDKELAHLETGYSVAAGKAWSVRQSLLGENAAAFSRAAAPVAPRAPPYRLKPSPTAVALRADMANTKSGWGQNDLRTLYLGYGFEEREGGKHRFYTHPAFPQLHDSVSRQNDLPPGYAHSALKLLDELDRLLAPSPASELPAPNDGPPVNLKLSDLAVLLSPPSAKERAPKPAPVPARVVAKTRPDSPRAPPSEPTTIARRETVSLQPYAPTTPEPEKAPPPAPEAKTFSGWERWVTRVRRLITPNEP